jgi:hypothetical protein
MRKFHKWCTEDRKSRNRLFPCSSYIRYRSRYKWYCIITFIFWTWSDLQWNEQGWTYVSLHWTRTLLVTIKRFTVKWKSKDTLDSSTNCISMLNMSIQDYIESVHNVVNADICMLICSIQQLLIWMKVAMHFPPQREMININPLFVFNSCITLQL